ncbi:hypothetical protein [Campylobacter showae]|uniref:hypothetical protein n=1 Tax=Campylobacter showae TaxID=204 RepID=UPI000F08CD6C|nr:hypothetical protein [Campylobacter showae]
MGGKIESQARSPQVALSLIIWSIMSVCELKFRALNPLRSQAIVAVNPCYSLKFDAPIGQI